MATLRRNLMYNTGHKGPNTRRNPDVITQYNFLSTWIKSHTKSERGAAMVEYALLVALIAIVAIAALQLLGSQVSSNFSSIDSSLSGAQSA